MLASNLDLKILIVVLAVALLLVMRAWLSAERYGRWYHDEYFKQPRIPGRAPRLTWSRSILFDLFGIRKPQR
jgi:hypothetical protein